MFAAKQLQKRLRGRAEIELINEVNYFVYQPLLPDVAAGGISTRDAVSPLRQLLPGVRVRQAKIFDVDFDAKIVTIFQGLQRRHTKVSYDHLVVALGQTVDLSRFPGVAEHALRMKTLGDAMQLRNHVIDKLEHAEVTAIPSVKRGLLTFTVIGGGFSGCETVGEMKDLIDRSLKYYPNIDPSEIRILLIEFADRLLGEMPENLGNYAAKFFRGRGIEVMLKTGVSEATGTQIVTSGGEVIDTRTLVATIGNAPSALVNRLKIPHDRGRIRTDRFLRVEGLENVWSLGDAAQIPMVEAPSTRYDYAPPTAQFAVREAACLAANMDAEFSHTPLKPFVYTSKGALASLGARRGVAEIYGIKLSGFPAWLLWRSYYLSFVPGFATKVRIASNWLLDELLGRNIVQNRGNRLHAARYLRYRAGDTLFEAGNRTDGLYSVIEGAFELRIADPKTGNVQVTRIGVGGHFGERVLLGEGLRAGSVVALEDSLVLMVEAEDFRRLVRHVPAMKAYFQDYIDANFTSPDAIPEEDHAPV